MKPRARRVTIAAAVLGVGVVGVLVVAHWGAVRDHVEAWWFQFTRKTETIEPDPRLKEIPRGEEILTQREEILAQFSITGQLDENLDYLSFPYLRILASYSGLKVIFASERILVTQTTVTLVGSDLRVDEIRARLELRGFRVLEQRFPQHAYVVIREKYGTR